MFERCHSSKEAALLLQDQYGLPVQLLGGRPVVTTGSVLGALVMPPALGHDVLEAMNCPCPVPVIADPGERTWTFLVTPPSPMLPVDQQVRQELAEHHVTVVPGGVTSCCPPPTPIEAGTGRPSRSPARWSCPPGAR